MIVLPTPVGVFPFLSTGKRTLQSPPHACGGVSDMGKPVLYLFLSSPRLWGCFTWQTYHRKILRPPHACGGVSSWRFMSIRAFWSSPRLWGCFFVDRHFVFPFLVLPTPVGVFLNQNQQNNAQWCPPHACGGVSTGLQSCKTKNQSSPRLWGCFQIEVDNRLIGKVLPTPVGVFLKIHRRDKEHDRPPHACGGVSIPCQTPSPLRQSSPRLWGCFCVLRTEPKPSIVLPTPVGVFPLDFAIKL